MTPTALPDKKPRTMWVDTRNMKLQEKNRGTAIVVDFPNCWRSSQSYSDFPVEPSATQRPYRTVRKPYFLHASKLMYLLPRTMESIRNCEFHLVASVSPDSSTEPGSYPIFKQYLKEKWHVHLSQRIDTATGQKEGVDVHLTTLAMRNFDRLDTLVLVSGDSDFLPLIREYRKNHKKVIVWAWKGSVAPSYIKSLEEINVQLYYLDPFAWLIGFIPSDQFNPDIYKPYELVCSSNRFTHYAVCDLVLSVAKEQNVEVDRNYCTILWNQGLKIAFRTEQQRENFLNSTSYASWCRMHDVNFFPRESENPSTGDDSPAFNTDDVTVLFENLLPLTPERNESGNPIF